MHETNICNFNCFLSLLLRAVSFNGELQLWSKVAKEGEREDRGM